MTDPVKPDDRMLAGRCLCGAVHYAVKDEFLYALNCHCSKCRRATGSAFKAFAGIERGKLEIAKGDGHVLVFGAADAVALVDPRLRQLLPLLGNVRNATSPKAERLLGWTPRPREEAIVAAAESVSKFRLVGSAAR